METKTVITSRNNLAIASLVLGVTPIIVGLATYLIAPPVPIPHWHGGWENQFVYLLLSLVAILTTIVTVGLAAGSLAQIRISGERGRGLAILAILMALIELPPACILSLGFWLAGM